MNTFQMLKASFRSITSDESFFDQVKIKLPLNEKKIIGMHYSLISVSFRNSIIFIAMHTSVHSSDGRCSL